MAASRRLFVVTVAPVHRKWGKKLTASLSAAGFAFDLLEMPVGERHKRLATLERLAEVLVKRGADRSAVIVAFGGGVVGDVVGLLASLYMRGVDLVQIPTTVQAQVDAAIGGKTGVNLKAGKNLIGTFHQPRVVLIDPAVLSTLPEREFRAGLYESLKCGVIGKPELFAQLEKIRIKKLRRDPEALEWVIAESVRLKAEVVSADERESGLRQVLNFGHTIGHALEAATELPAFSSRRGGGLGHDCRSRHCSRGRQTGSRRQPSAFAEAVLAFGPSAARRRAQPEDSAPAASRQENSRRGGSLRAADVKSAR